MQLQDDRQSVSSNSNKKTKNNEGVFGIGKSTIDNRVRKDKKFKLVSQGNELTKEQQEFFKDSKKERNSSITRITSLYNKDNLYNYLLKEDKNNNIIDCFDKKNNKSMAWQK